MLKFSRTLKRMWITPGPHKGWNPSDFESMGQAMLIARTAKRYSLAKLSIATNISSKSLWMFQTGQAAPLPEELKKIEKYLGVPLLIQKKSRIERAI